MDKKELAQFLIDNAEIIGITRSYKNEEYFEQTIKLGPLSNKIKDIDKDTVEVEVEEEITEDTLLEEVLLIVNDGLGVECFRNQSINNVLGNNEGYYKECVMFILKPQPTIIWTLRKVLVEKYCITQLHMRLNDDTVFNHNIH